MLEEDGGDDSDDGNDGDGCGGDTLVLINECTSCPSLRIICHPQ